MRNNATKSRWARLFLAVGASLLIAPSAAVFARDPTTDRPEPGKQGETMPGEEVVLATPYSKGVDVIGHVSPGGRSGNLIMAWADHCAYVASGLRMTPGGPVLGDQTGPTAGVAVIDAADASAPRVVRYLQDKGALNATETMQAVEAPDRKVLAASTYGGVAGVNGPTDGWLDVYDISDCANPRLTAEVKWPERSIH
jgi:hypothetical protein